MKTWSFIVGKEKHAIPDHPRLAWESIQKIVGKRYGLVSVEELKNKIRSGIILDENGKDRTCQAVRDIGKYFQTVQRHKHFAKIDRQKRRNTEFCRILVGI